MVVSKTSLIEKIQRLAKDGEPPTEEYFNRNSEHSSTTVRNKFGSWNAAIKKAGFTPSRKSNITEGDLIADVQRLAEDGEPPTADEFANRSEYSLTAVRERFGSWNDLIRKAGFIPHRYVSDAELLKQLADDTAGQIGVSKDEFDGRYESRGIYDRMGWWEASVRAGLRPYRPRPLAQLDWERFFHTASTQQDPKIQLIGLLAQLTGLTDRLIREISTDWVTERANDVLVTVPENMTKTGDKWTFRIPPIFTDCEGKKHKTKLGGLLLWCLDNHQITHRGVFRLIYELAGKAGLEEREFVNRSRVGTVPLVRPVDLRVTGGIQMARNGAPESRIRRHLGMDHTNWEVTIDELFLWCHIHHEDFHHSDSEVDGIYLDPDTGQVREINSEAN